MPSDSNLTRRQRDLSLLSLDAGGSRGISQLKMLAEILRRLESDETKEQNGRPCAIFDMICGVGSGGFISILLVIFGLTVEEAMQEFIDLGANVLEKRAIDASERTMILREYIKNLMEKHGISPTTLLLDSIDRSRDCKLVIPISYRNNVGSTCILRNFNVRQEQAVNLTVAEALLATLAVPPLFTSTKVFKDATTFEYIGADWVLSNPTQEIITEAYQAFGSDKRVACLLSLRCGSAGVFAAPEHAKSTEWNIFLERLATDEERTARPLELRMGTLGLYYRFSVTQGLERETQSSGMDLGAIMAHTAVYLGDGLVSQKVDMCTESIRLRDGISTLEQLVYSGGQTTVAPPLPPITQTFVMRKEPWDFVNRVLLEPRAPGNTDGPRILVITG